METINKTYRVPEKNLDALKRRIEKLARRCKRIKIQAPVLVINPTPEEVRVIINEMPSVRRYFSVTLDSPERPKIDGYEFIAVLSPVADDEGTVLGNVLRAVPGASVTPEERFRTADNYCDHCKTNRRRLETFVITDGTTQRQIGRNCLANYLGLVNPHALAELAEILIGAADIAEMSEDDDFEGGRERVEHRFPLDSILELAASAIRNYGWLSNKSANEFGKTSTSGRVSQWIFDNAQGRAKWNPPLDVTDADKQLAAETEEWLGQITDTTNDYMFNLSLLALASSVTPKNFGIVVSAINAYSRDKERTIRRNAQIESDKNSNFIGAVGERITFENLLLVFTTTFETDFGTTTLYKMKSGDNVVVYFSSRDLGFKQGATLPAFVATVKKHELRDEIKQTIVTRGKIAPRALSKPDKKAINKLKKINKTFVFSDNRFSWDIDDVAAVQTISDLIERIQNEGLEAIS